MQELTLSRLEQIEKMLAAEPADVFLNFSLAMEYVHAGRQEDAIAQFVRVADLDSDYVAVYPQWANLLIGLGRKEEAQGVLSRGIASAERIGDKHAGEKMTETMKVLGGN